MTVALVHGGVGSQTIQVAFPVDVIDPCALGSVYHHVEGVVVVRPIGCFQVDEVLGVKLVFECKHKILIIWESAH